MSKTIEGILSGTGMKFAIITTRWNDFITERLLNGARTACLRHGVDASSIDEVIAPGAFEVPFIARKLAQTGKYDAVIALGCVIRGGTAHFDYVAGEAARGIASAMHDTGVPISFGILTVDTIEQAIERTGTKAGNKGEEAALAAIETATLAKAIEEA